MEEGRSSFEISIDRRAGKRSPGRNRRGWEDRIRIYFQELSVSARN